MLPLFEIRQRIRQYAFDLFAIIGAITDIDIDITFSLRPVVHNARYDGIRLDPVFLYTALYAAADQHTDNDHRQKSCPQHDPFIHSSLLITLSS